MISLLNLRHSFSRYGFLSILFILAGTVLYAQNKSTELRGVVYDSTNQKPVSFATVFINPQTATITDENGNFRLILKFLPPRDTLNISCIGYEDKQLPLGQLSATHINTIYLKQSIYEMDEVVIEAKPIQLPPSEKIVQAALSWIPVLYPNDPVLYKGYYREYLKEGDNFINLFESILSVKDFAMNSEENFLASLDYKRLNDDFSIDSSLFRTYDNREKFVPLAKVHLVGENELSVLMSTNPLKYGWGKSISFIDNFRTDFVKNHAFGKTRMTVMNGRRYFVIPFEDIMKYHTGTYRVRAEGTIYIDFDNLGVKKLNYRATLVTGTYAKKLYELNVEYALKGQKYYLNYISYNNLFETSGFTFNGAGIEENNLVLSFTRDVDPGSVTAGDLRVLFDKKEQPIDSCLAVGNRILLTFPKSSDISRALHHGFSPFHSKKERIREVLSRVNIEFNGIRDVHKHDLSSQAPREYYQYREYFVHETTEPPPPLGKNLIDEKKPVFENAVSDNPETEHPGWFNSPLIRENLDPKRETTHHPLFDRFIQAIDAYSSIRQEEIIFIHTDREVYAPGDTLWFKGYIRNKQDLNTSYLSQCFYTRLTDSAGMPVSEQKWLTKDAGAQGQIVLSPTLAEGFYLLTGYSSWMKNSGPGVIFKKRILIQKEKAAGLHLRIRYDREDYLPGDTVHFIITCLDEYSRPVQGIKFSTTIETPDGPVFECSGETSSLSDSSYTFILPVHLNAQPEVNVKGRDTDLRLRLNDLLPVNYFVAVEFFPEGGHCLNQTKSNIAFKAVTRQGRPFNISGEIVDKKGKTNGTFRSSHDGMGQFTVRISNDDSLFLRILQPGIFRGQSFPLPEARESGWQLAVQNKGHLIKLDVTSKNVTGDTALVTLMVRGKLCYHEVVVPGDKPKIIIPTEDFPQGIAVITLFNKFMIPQNERLVFINDPESYTAEMTTDKKAYGTRDSVRLEINLPGDIRFPSKGSWSLSVVDDQLCMTDLLDEPSLVTSWLLSPEIKGKIYHLNSYLYPCAENTAAHIEALLLTQGWRDYTEMTVPPARKPVNRDLVTGTLMKEPLGREKQPAEGTLNIFFGGGSTKIPVGKNGRFSFLPDSHPGNNTGLFLNAVDNHGTPRISIHLDQDPFDQKLDHDLSQASNNLSKPIESEVFTYNRFSDHFSYSMINHQWLEEVVITKKLKPREFEMADLANMKRSADKTDLENAQTMEDLWFLVDPERAIDDRIIPFYRIDGIMQCQVEPISVENAKNYQISNVIPDYSMAIHLYPQDIEKYTVVRDENEAQALYGFGFKYVIDVKLKPLNEQEGGRIWENPVIIRKFDVAKTFYDPKYETEAERYSQVPDLRKTLYWNPNVKFSSDRKAVIRYFNGDRYSRIHCIFEGVDDTGIPVHSEHMFDVEVK